MIEPCGVPQFREAMLEVHLSTLTEKELLDK